MNIGEIQKKIGELENKFKVLNIQSYYDKNNNYRIKKNSYYITVKLVTSKNDIIEEKIINDILFISLVNDDFNSNYVLRESDIDKLISIKNNYDEKVYNAIEEYLLFNKKTSNFLKTIDVLLDAIENKKEPKEESTENKVKKNSSVQNKNEIIMEMLNSEFSNSGGFKKSNKYYISNDKSTAVLAMISKRYEDRSAYKYWYTFHKYQKDVLDNYKNSYIMLYFSDKDKSVIIDTKNIYKYLVKLNKTEHGESIGWHIHVAEKNDEYMIRIPNEGLLNLKDNTEIKKETKKGTTKAASNKSDAINSNPTIKISLKDFKVIKI